MIKAITFDLFDTLIPAADFHRRRQLRLHDFICRRIKPVSLERFLEVERMHLEERLRRISLTLEEVVYRDRFRPLFRELTGMEPDDSVVDEAEALTYDEMTQSLDVPPLVPPLLEHLSETHPLAIVSNFPVSRPIFDGLARTGILRYFAAVVISCDVGLAKPHPKIFLCSASALSVHPGEILHVGDDWVCDVLGAANVGGAPVFLTQWNDEEKLRLSRIPENMQALCAHLDIGPDLDGVPELKDLAHLPELLNDIAGI